jgi:hypothetical protein
MDAAEVVAEVANVNLCAHDDGGACNNDGNTGADDAVMADVVAAEAPAAQALRHSKLHRL